MADLEQNVTINSVDTQGAIALGGYFGRGGQNNDTSDDNPGVAWFTFELTSDTNLLITRDVTNSSDSKVGWFVVDFCGASWYEEDWSRRRKIRFDNTGRGALNDFPALVCLDSSFDYGNAQTNGEDVRFVDEDDTTLLNHEIESWNDGSGNSYIWVKVPQIDADTGEDFIYMYYGNPSASAPSAASEQATWSNSFDSVYHVHGGDFSDSSGTQAAGTNNGTTAGSTSPLAGEYRFFEGEAGATDDYIDTNWTPNYGTNDDFTWEGWFRTTSSISSSDNILGIEERFAGCSSYCGDRSEIRLAIRRASGVGAVDMWNVYLWPDSTPDLTYEPSLTVDTNWHYVVLERDGSTGRVFFDGSQVTSPSVSSGTIDFPTYTPQWPSTTVTLLVGAQWHTDNPDGSVRNLFEGDLDELRTSFQVARSADWIDATYDNIINCSTFSSVSEETTAVSLVSFAAQAFDGAVELTWETGSEIDNLGFHLYRAASEDGPYGRITAGVIPGLGSSPEGARYSYVDSGLMNGVTYYYKLEDIETTGATEFHGPVAATPVEGASPVIVEPEEGEEGGSSRITYGKPWENEVRLQRLGQRGLVLELITEGFYAYPEEDGSVRLEVPGLELVAEPGEPAVPVCRGWVEAVVGRKVKVGKARVENIDVFTSLRPSSAEAPDVIGSSNGTARAVGKKVRRAFLRNGELYPAKPAQLVNVAFQGEEKKALIELAPVRWDGALGRLLLARRLRVRVSFKGREPSETLTPSGKGRRHVENHESRKVLAQFAAQEPGLYGVRFKDVFGQGAHRKRTSELRLSRQGEAVAFRVMPNAKTFKRGSVLYFLSEGAAANPYGQEAVYGMCSTLS